MENATEWWNEWQASTEGRASLSPVFVSLLGASGICESVFCPCFSTE